jgi:hypothetical protein
MARIGGSLFKIAENAGSGPRTVCAAWAAAGIGLARPYSRAGAGKSPGYFPPCPALGRNFLYIRSMKKLLLWSTLILTIALFLEYWIFDNPVFHIPERISIAGTSINIAGALLLITFVALQIILIKKIQTLDPPSSWLKLMGFGTFPVFIAEGVFQWGYWWRQEDAFVHYVKHLTECTVLGLLIAFCITFQLKTRKPLWFILIIPGLVIILGLVSGVGLEPFREAFKQAFHQNNF